MRVSKVLITVLMAAVLCAGMTACQTEPAVESVSSESDLQASEAVSVADATYLIADMNGEFIDMDNFSIVGLKLDYTYGWNLDASGYIRIEKGDTVAGGEVVEINTEYLVGRYFRPSFDNQGDVTAQIRGSGCSVNQFVIQSVAPMTGILEITESNIFFYPYFNEQGNNLLHLTAREDMFEQAYRERSSLTIGEGKTVTTQPAAILIIFPENNSVISAISEYLTGTSTSDANYLLEFTEPRYLEVEMCFSSIQSSGQSVGDGIYRTAFVGNIDPRGLPNPGTISIIRSM